VRQCNNEDYQVAESTRAYRPDTPGDPAAFPGRILYEQVLPEVCARLDPDRPYQPGSPYGGTRTVNDPTVGDRHVWDVWHGSMAEYGQYARFAGRFVSEFGMQGLPDPATIAAFAQPTERFAQSRTLEFHNKAGGGARRLAVYLTDTVRFPADFAGYIYATQFVQAEALATALRDWRRRWGGPGRELTAGALLWQLEDCWPGVSWSIVDYFDRPKPAWYAVRRALAPLALGLALADDRIAVWGTNGTLRPARATLELRTWTLDGQALDTRRREVTWPRTGPPSWRCRRRRPETRYSPPGCSSTTASSPEPHCVRSRSNTWRCPIPISGLRAWATTGCACG
jgi:beta-mannosidase